MIPSTANSTIVDDTIKERGKVYGPPKHSHDNIGLCWTGIIQQHYGITLDYPLPAHLVELMMAQFKIQRAARVYHADNYVDVAAYLKFAETDQQTYVPPTKQQQPIDSERYATDPSGHTGIPGDRKDMGSSDISESVSA